MSRDDEVIEMIIGRSLDADLPARARRQRAGVGRRCLGARDLAPAASSTTPASTLRQGEILGVAGLQGMGQQDLFLACFGMAEIDQRRDRWSTASRS